MNIYVLMKRTFDTEEKIIIRDGEVDKEGAEFIINPYDEYAIEEAIVLREAHGGEVTVITVGDEDAQKELRTALAMGADKAVLINLEELEGPDHFTISEAISSWLADKDVDIILGGNVAVDDGAGQVASRVAEKLGINQVTTITELTIEDETVKIERDVEGDIEKIETTLPLLVTCQQGLNEPRYPSLPGIMKAKKKPLANVGVNELEMNEKELTAKTKTIDRFLPPPKAKGKILEGDIDQQVNELVHLLKNEAKVI
ncbi:electron transfer flavoprotein subunit beta/FixA family protein [Bacillus piscicola]|uniref:electron transfer flavoprotein subunit beta/FixA family protein n=1 Tax=Bacillus piscicola TaxID=1632684 RepID=UPI001F0888B8|nr:electron transfer flavoprotein subunit beta/FixA family protein [Bacillus piscicola]